MRIIKILAVAVLAGTGGIAMAKLPAPSPEAKAKADETAARLAWSTKVDGYKLCQSQDKVAAEYRNQAQAAGKPAPTPVATPPCSDPGPFKYVAAPPEQRPLETSGAHSPATPAASPHNEKETRAEQEGRGDNKTQAAPSNGPATVTQPTTQKPQEPVKR